MQSTVISSSKVVQHYLSALLKRIFWNLNHAAKSHTKRLFSSKLYFLRISDTTACCRYIHFKLAADQGNANAQYHYADMRYYGEGGKADRAEAIKYFKLAIGQGDVNAQLDYADKLFIGKET